MPQPEADYEIDFDEDEKRALRELQADQARRDRTRTPPPAAEVISPADDRELAVVQGRASVAGGGELTVTEGVIADDHNTIEFMGRKFRVAEKVGLMPLLKYASAADMSTDDPRALAAIYAMIRDCIHQGAPGCGECADCEAGQDTRCKAYDKGDWADFEDHAIATKADAEELLPVISQVTEIIAGRPTKPPAGSSTGRRATRGSSTGSSSARRGGGSKR